MKSQSQRKLDWYWEHPEWDDLVLEAQVDRAIRSGTCKPPDWKWKTPRPYNGFFGEARIAGWKKVKVALKLGLLPKPERCSICLRSPAGQFHNEDYSRPLKAKPICPSCHRILHQRFRYPETWSNLLTTHSQPGAWFAHL